MKNKRKMFFIKLPYWLGVVADAYWSIGLIFPSAFDAVTGRPEMILNLQTRLIMGIGGVLMTGWTILLIWALRDPIKRKEVILITAFPVVFGLSIIALLGYLDGNTQNLWILIKCLILFISMITSYILATQVERKES